MKYYLVGIKGTGMSSLAKLLKDHGHLVVGSDVDEKYFTEDSLLARNIPIYHFNKDNLSSDFFYIIGNAYDSTNIEVKTIIDNGYHYLYYHDFIGQKLKYHIIACSGTHGKTTTSFLTTNFLNYKCNYIIGDGEGGGNLSDILVLEACEYKEHFLSYYPEILIINNIELDHTDFYKNKKQLLNAFQKLANNSKLLLVNGDDKLCQKIIHPHKITYGFGKKNDIVISILSTTSKGYYLKVKYHDNFYLKVPYLGKHMIYNYVAGYFSVKLLKKEPFCHFNSLPKKRLMIKQFKKAIIVDDYAHHPTEIKALHDSIRLMYKNKKINVIFQPHTYERTMHFKKAFKKVLKKFDEVYIMDVFTSKREKFSVKYQNKVNKIFKKFNRIDKLALSTIGSKDEVWIFLGAGLASNFINVLNNEK